MGKMIFDARKTFLGKLIIGEYDGIVNGIFIPKRVGIKGDTEKKNKKIRNPRRKFDGW